MNLDELHKKLIGAARHSPPRTDVPYAFEQRILARLRQARPAIDPWMAWGQGLWRASVPCIAVLGLVVAWNWIQPNLSSDSSAPYGDELEVAVVDGIDTPDLTEEGL